MKQFLLNNPYNIETPETVGEFRGNLQKYYACIYNNAYDGRIVCNGLYVNTLVDRSPQIVPIDQISSFNDLANKIENPMIIPRVKIEKGYDWKCKKDYSLWDKNTQYNDFFPEERPEWVTLENELWRPFYEMTLGDFSGYLIGGMEVL